MRGVSIPFANQDGQSSVTQNSRETLTNMFAEIETSNGRSKIVRRQRVGLSLAYALIGEKRCIEYNLGVTYVVVGAKFYTFNGTTLTERGTLDTITGACTMVFDDNDYVAISDGATLYHWNGSSFTKPTTQTAVGTLAFLSGYCIYNEPDSDVYWWSAVNDMTSWDALDFATAEGNADLLVRVYVDHNELWLFGETTTEIKQLSGDSDAPFSALAQMQRGSAAALSVIAEDNTVFWLGNDLVFYRADGFRPSRISTHSIERRVEALSEAARAACEAFVYTDGGHKFVTFNFPGYLTVQYNVATGLWNVAKTYEADDWQVYGTRCTQAGYVLTTAGISTLSRAVNTDNGTTMVRGGVSAPIADGANRVTVRWYHLDCEVGRAAIGVEPQVMLRVARDGESFGNEKWRSLGTIGDYAKRAVWRSLGVGRKMAIEVAFSDDADFTIINAEADARVHG